MSTGLTTREPYGIVRRWGGGGSYPVPFTSGMGVGRTIGLPLADCEGTSFAGRTEGLCESLH